MPKLLYLALRQLHRSDERESAALQKLPGDYPKTITRHLVSASQACGRESSNYLKKYLALYIVFINQLSQQYPISFVKNRGSFRLHLHTRTTLRCISSELELFINSLSLFWCFRWMERSITVLQWYSAPELRSRACKLGVLVGRIRKMI